MNSFWMGGRLKAPVAVSGLLLAAGLQFSGPAPAATDEAQPGLEEVVVTGQRRPEPWLDHHGNIQRLDRRRMDAAGSQHPAQSFEAVAGAWVMRGSGQESQLAVRSPLLGGAGGCGSVLLLEDGVPVRPSGFCNSNQLAELAPELASSMEVSRGPGNALHGAGAMHGVINVLMPNPGSAPGSWAALEAGPNDYLRGRGGVGFGGESGGVLSAAWAHDGGFRAQSGYDQAKVHAALNGTAWGGDLSSGFTATRLRQDTAGFIYGENAFRDEALSATNPDAGAFRDMDALRLSARWSKSSGRVDWDLRPYLRHTDMTFMHYAQPGRPVEDNGHASAGLLANLRLARGPLILNVGMDMEWAEASLRQVQYEEIPGPARLRAVRPVGRQYDYDVDSLVFAPFVQAEWRPGDRWSVGAGLRFEATRYAYDNHLPDGRLREDGTPCGFGGCLASRPADRTDRFHHASPNLSLAYRHGPDSSWFAGLTQGFRVPQTLELYRLQNGQTVSDLDSEEIDSLELGWRRTGSELTVEWSVYAMRKRNSVYRDAEGFNVSGARSRHQGVEVALDWGLSEDWSVSFSGTWARHVYDFDFSPQRGETFVAGNDMDTAPRLQGSMTLRWRPTADWSADLRWGHMGKYFLEPQNRYDYPGHDLFDLRLAWAPSQRFSVALRGLNLLDRRFADRADFGAGDYRYLPGRGREWFVEFRWNPR